MLRQWFRSTFSSLVSAETIGIRHLADTGASARPTLSDKFGRRHNYLRISLTERCNLRCLYCMPKEGIKLTDKLKCLTLDELKRLSELLVKQCGIDKVRLTGGEPTIDAKLVPMIEHLNKLRNFGLNTIAITTNGLTLKHHARLYKKSGLDAVNISLDTLKPERYEQISRRKGFQLAYSGLTEALSANFSLVKLNCVIIKGFNEDEIGDFVQLACQHSIEVRFIEFMPFAGNNWSKDRMVPWKDILAVCDRHVEGLQRLPIDQSQVSKTFKAPGMKGQLGFITSMTDNFCSGCNRLRITADGNLKVCLFGREETSLRDLIRNGATDGDIVHSITMSLTHKRLRHMGGQTLVGDVYRPMVKIGIRGYHNQSSSGSFTHIDKQGQANMVDVGYKKSLKRVAIAKGQIKVGATVLSLILDQSIPKGDVLSVARVAGILGAKATSQLIPLCHQVPLSHVTVDIKLCQDSQSLLVEARAEAIHTTGVEMESLTAVSITLLTLYDMCKSINKSMTITNVMLESKVKS